MPIWYYELMLNIKIPENNPNYSVIQLEFSTFILSYFKAEVNSDKNILLICSYLTENEDLCLFFDLKQKQN